MEKTYMDRFVNRFGLFIVLFAGIVLIAYFVLINTITTKQNNGYVRVINCVSSVPLENRTKNDIEKCYQLVETDLNIHLDRYNLNPKSE